MTATDWWTQLVLCRERDDAFDFMLLVNKSKGEIREKLVSWEKNASEAILAGEREKSRGFKVKDPISQVTYFFFHFFISLQSQPLDSFYLNPAAVFKNGHNAGHWGPLARHHSLSHKIGQNCYNKFVIWIYDIEKKKERVMGYLFFVIPLKILNQAGDKYSKPKSKNAKSPTRRGQRSSLNIWSLAAAALRRRLLG